MDIKLYIGETWVIPGTVGDVEGTPVDITGGSIEMRISDANGELIKLAADDVDIVLGTTGQYILALDSDDERQLTLREGIFDYEIVAITADGGVTIQNEGNVTLRKSLRSRDEE